MGSPFSDTLKIFPPLILGQEKERLQRQKDAAKKILPLLKDGGWIDVVWWLGVRYQLV